MVTSGHETKSSSANSIIVKYHLALRTQQGFQRENQLRAPATADILTLHTEHSYH